MPQVKEGLKRAFPNLASKIKIYEPEKAIALGAAIYVQHCDPSIAADSFGSRDDIVSDIAPLSYGIRTLRDFDADPTDKIIVNIIIRGDRLPKSNSHNFLTATDDQTYVSFKVYESDNKSEQQLHF